METVTNVRSGARDDAHERCPGERLVRPKGNE